MAWIIKRPALRLSRLRGRKVFNYHVGYRDPTTRKARSVCANTTNRVTADAYRRQVEATLESGLEEVRPVGEYFEDFLAWKAARVKPGTVEFYRSALGHFVREWGDVPFHKWTPSGFAEYVDGKVAGRTSERRAWSPRTAQMCCTAVSQFCRFLRSRGVEVPEITKEVDVGDTRRAAKQVIQILKWPDVQQLLLQAQREEHFLLLAVALAALGGLRRAEMQRLRWEGDDARVDLEEGVLLIDGKTGQRTVPLEPQLHEHLEAVPDDQRTGYVLKRFDRNPRNGNQHYKALRQLCERAGVRYLGWHGLRKSFCSALFAAKGGDPAAIMEIMGHSNLKTTTRYSRAYEAQKRRAIDGLATLEAS